MLQLFENAFRPLAERKALQERLAQQQRDEAFKRQTADELNARYIQLENLRAQNSQQLADKTQTRAERLAELQAKREDTRWTEQAKRADAQAESMATRQQTALDAAEAKQLTAQINLLYPKYVKAAKEAGIEVIPRTDFSEDSSGLGALTVALGDAEDANLKKKQAGMAKVAVAEIANIRSAVENATAQLQTLAQPSDEDRALAESRAIAATEKEVEMNKDTLGDKAAKDGMAALRVGDTTIAKQKLGDKIYGVYDTTLKQTLMALLNQPARRQQSEQTTRGLLALQAQMKEMAHSYRIASQQNPELAAQLENVLTPVQKMMSPDAGIRSRSFEELTPPPGTPASVPAPSVVPVSPAAQPGTLSRGLSSLMSIGGSEINRRAPWVGTTLGALGRAGSATGNAIGSAGSAVIGGAQDLGTKIVNPTETILQILEAEAARRRAALNGLPLDESVIGP